MARYRFHCTNGKDCVFDGSGAVVRSSHTLARRAERVARNVMRTLDGEPDWSRWSVTVHDLRGRQVLRRPFVPAAQAASGARS